MVSKSTNEKLKQGIAVRFHGEEGMVGLWIHDTDCLFVGLFQLSADGLIESKPVSWVVVFVSACFRARV